MSSDYLAINRDLWNTNASNWVDAAERLWWLDMPKWGSWGHPDAGLHLLPDDMTGRNAVELGCGTG